MPDLRVWCAILMDMCMGVGRPEPLPVPQTKHGRLGVMPDELASRSCGRRDILRLVSILLRWVQTISGITMPLRDPLRRKLPLVYSQLLSRLHSSFVAM